MDNHKVYIETYGCQMNFNDTEIVSSVIRQSGYEITDKPDKADVILLNTCSVRENAERKIHERVKHLKKYKKDNKHLVVGILGCMAERLRSKLLEEKEIVDIVVGPDEYRKVPQLIENALTGEKGIAVRLSRAETYDDIVPLRTEGISAWVSVMRGCNNFCSYCVVPYTRGRERSRAFDSIVNEIVYLSGNGFREVTLLGQNVNSYNDKTRNDGFPGLLSAVAAAVPQMRIRFVTSHPRDMSDSLAETMARHDNICKHIHLPVQSGSNRILALMNRKYTVGHYIGRVEKIKEFMPNVSLSTDIIAGYPTETEEDHQATLRLLEIVRYDGAFMFKYSPRENTQAYKVDDDVPEDVKIRRLNEIISLQHEISRELNKLEIGRVHEVIAEGPSKRNADEWQGRSDTNKVVIFHKPSYPEFGQGSKVMVKITKGSSATLFGETI